VKGSPSLRSKVLWAAARSYRKQSTKSILVVGYQGLRELFAVDATYHKCIPLCTSDVACCIEQEKSFLFPMEGFAEALAHAVVACRRLRLDGVPCAENGQCQLNVPSSGGQSRSALCIWQDFDFGHLVELFWSAGIFPHVYHLFEQKDTNNMGSAEPSCLHFATVCGKE